MARWYIIRGQGGRITFSLWSVGKWKFCSKQFEFNRFLRWIKIVKQRIQPKKYFPIVKPISSFSDKVLTTHYSINSNHDTIWT